jgi:hypothetical protein
MMTDEPEPGHPVHLTADEARGGEAILRTRGRRAIFLIGLAGAILLGVLLMLFEYR